MANLPSIDILILFLPSQGCPKQDGSGLHCFSLSKPSSLQTHSDQLSHSPKTLKLKFEIDHDFEGISDIIDVLDQCYGFI